MTITFRKTSLIVCLSILTCTALAQAASKSVKLITNTYFKCFTFDLPDNLKRTSEAKIEESTNIVVYANDKDNVDVMIRLKKEMADLKDIKELHENMATSFYNGTILRSEFVNVAGQNVFVFLMTGHWNGDKKLTTWLKCFVASKDITYQFLIHYPKDYKKYDSGVLNKIIGSIRLCK